MFKNLLVPATGGPEDGPVFATARLVAEGFGAHLEFLHVRPDTTEVLMSMTAGGVGGGDAVQSVVDNLEAEAQAHEETARAGVRDFMASAGIAERDTPDGSPDGNPVSGAMSVEQGTRSAWVAQYGRFADLVVMGRGAPDDDTNDSLEAALMDTGKPLLIAPRDAPAAVGRTVIIAWKDTPEAARAVAGALPFIARAERVVIATVADDEESQDPTGERLLHALRWHNPKVELRRLLSGGSSAVDVLHGEATALGADLLVMGGYSHSRLREVVFGGFTRQTLRNSAMAVLMAH